MPKLYISEEADGRMTPEDREGARNYQTVLDLVDARYGGDPEKLGRMVHELAQGGVTFTLGDVVK